MLTCADVPSIISGDTIAYLDPQERVWPRESGKWYDLHELLRNNSLVPFNGIEDFNHRTTTNYQKTLFRFPLRNRPSDLSETTYDVDSIIELTGALKDEAKFLLLFLRSVHTITVSKINRNASRQLLFQVQVTADSRARLTQQRTSFMSELKRKHSLRAYRINPCISNVLRFSVEIKDTTNIWQHQHTSSKTHSWLVTNQVGSHNMRVLEAAGKQHTFPWVGAALELGEYSNSSTSANGRIFCFLPMPAETTSKLPVHVNGTFGLNDDRRTIKWPGGERRNDPTAQWNQMLVKECLPSCYNNLLMAGVRENHITSSDFLYQALPCIDMVQQSHWSMILEPLYKFLFEWKWLQAMGSIAIAREWVKIETATITTRLDSLHEVVKSVLTDCGLKMVELPDHIYQALNTYYPYLVPLVSPIVARGALKSHPHTYRSKSSRDKLELLRYCLADNSGAHSDLDGLELIPLADGNFKTFSDKDGSRRRYLYVCSNKFPRKLFPHCDNRLIDIQDADLQKKLSYVANSIHTQLVKLDIEFAVYLLQSSYPPSWKGKRMVEVYREIPHQWFAEFWKWVQGFDLSQFKTLFIIPIVTSNVSLSVSSMRVARLTTLAESSVVLIPKYLDCSMEMLNILHKFGIQHTMQLYVHYLEHNQLHNYVHAYTPSGILTAISNSCPNPSSIELNENEATGLRTFLSSLSPFQTQLVLTNDQMNVLSNLQIFKVFNCDEHVSLQGARNSSWNKQIVVEPPEFTFSQESLPFNLVVLSRGNNQSSLLSLISNQNIIPISFPISQIGFIIDDLIPFIESNLCPGSKVNPLMEHVLQLMPILQKRYHAIEYYELPSKLSRLPFLNVDNSTSSPRKAPQELYDCSKPEIHALFQGKQLFPRPPFTNYLSQLRECKLQTSVGGDVLLSLIHDNAVQCINPTEPQIVSKQSFSQAKAILGYIRKVPSVLDIIPRGRTQTLESVLKSISNTLCWLPVCATPPEGYNKYLPWKGSSCTSHLTALTNLVSLCSRQDLDTLPHLVGSQMYIVECPSKLCQTLQTSSVLIKAILDHFKVIIKNRRDIETSDLDEQVLRVYHYLQENLSALQSTYSTSELCYQNYIWFKKQHKFVAPKAVVLQEHPTFSNTNCLYPYYIQLPDNLARYAKLLAHFGVQEKLTDSNIVSVLQLIENDKQNTSQAWKTVDEILNWLTNNDTEDACNKLAESDTLLVPIESPMKLCLTDVKDVIYSDLDFLKSFKNIGKPVHFIHRKFAHLAPRLGVKSLTGHLDISRDAFADVGQHESLVTRLRNILRDYQGGLTIIKELLQNADDAGATEMTICHDSRTHSIQPESLMFTGMAECHGPALLVHNNATFSDEDFKNITKLADATKLDQPLKIGKFGVGFCSVYHLTDIPSFITREWLYIFDPTISYLKKEIIDRSRPGKKILFTHAIVHQSKQLIPYKDMFGFDQKKPYQGTLFRFPFRTSASELSSLVYSKKKVEHLLKDVQKAGSKLLLFLNNLKRVTVSSWDTKKNEPTVLWHIEKSIIYHVPSISHQSEIEGEGKNCICQIKGCDDTDHMLNEHWLVSQNKCSPGTSESELSLASVACLLQQHHRGKYSPTSVEGEMFCYLPLSLKTGLPVHVSANFAVLNDRSGIHSSDSEGSTSDHVQWNVRLMETVVPKAYFSMLLALKQLCSEHKISMSDYKFFSLWPLEKCLKVHNPWDTLIFCLYQSLPNSQLFYSACCSQWAQLVQVRILSSSILSISTAEHSPPDCVINAAEQLGYLLIDLPTSYQRYLPPAIIKACLVDEEQFLNYFFNNIANIPKDDRNEVLFLTFKGFAFRSEGYIERLLKKNKCIPSSPHGNSIKMCSDIVDPKAEFSCLYDQSDHVFPLEIFYENKHVCSTMKELGMIHSHLPTPMIVERAKTILSLFSANKRKALEKSKTILQCITQLVSQSGYQIILMGLVEVEFLPVMKRPETYPTCLQWFGERQGLLSGKELVKGSESAALLAGSQVCILNESKVEYGGCGHVPKDTATAIGISLYPSCDSIIKHLKHIEAVYTQERNKRCLEKWVESACEQIYGHLDSQIYECQISNDELKELKTTKSLWTGHGFISPDVVAKSWDGKGPYLYSVHYLLKTKNNLIRVLEFKDKFSPEDFLHALEQAYEENNGRSITHEKAILKTILDILHELVRLLNGTDSDLTEDQVCYVPDTSGILRKTSELAYNDAPWCEVGEGMFFVHDEVPRGIATKLGVIPVRSKALEQYESTEQHWDGVPFGQHEKLTQRIRNILEDYPRGITVLKELLQNADDAKATKMYVILDKRKHGREKLPSSEWEDLQGPALLVWNDRGFSEVDLKGIQELGLGSKRSSSESIGQFGIGFNVVYHLTDCPSFFTNGDTFCVLDPHCRYVPRADALKPGRRYDGVDTNFWNRWNDLKSAYLYQGSVEKCPEEVQNSGTLFRFPLRHTQELVQRSELISEESLRFGSNVEPLTARKMKDDLSLWFQDLKEALLFLNNVTELKLFEIERNSTMVLTHHYSNRLIVERNAEFLQKFNHFAETRESFIENYSVFLHELLPHRNIEKWMIQVGIGDMQDPQQHWKYLPKIKPRHGLAFPINKVDFNGRIFCFLPLPSLSNLPVHVNGDFILDSARSGLWTSRDSPDTDERYKWNCHLLEAIASSYVELLVTCQDMLFPSAACQSSQDMEDAISKYYKLFPRWLDSEHKLDSDMQFLATLVYQKLSLLKSPVLIANSDTNVKWLPPTDTEDPSQQVHFWDELPGSSLPPILKRIGINLTVAPMSVKNHFEDCGINLPTADPVTAYNYYCLHFSQVSEVFPCPITETHFQSVEDFLKFVKYTLQPIHLEEEAGIFMKFPEPPDGTPFLLTSDENLHCFSESEDKVICSEFSMIFATECGDKFLHPEMNKLKLTPDYFIRPGEENWDMISRILHSVLPECLRVQKITNASDSIDIQNLLSPLWKCLISDKVFRFHSHEIVEEWALLLTTGDELFAYKSNQQLLPIVPPRRQRRISQTFSLHQSEVLEILEEHGMPVLNTKIVDPTLCQQFCPRMSEPERILKNLVYLCKQSGLRSLMNDSCTDQILALFIYFRQINFVCKPESLSDVKSLPLFKDIRDGKYCTLSGDKVYIWPHNVILLDIGREMWIEQTSVVYLRPSGNWNRLGDRFTLKLDEISPLLVYTKFILPHFHLLSYQERMTHLEHIRDTESLFNTAWDNRNKKDIREAGICKWSVDFIAALKKLPCLLKNGELQPISEFCDPDLPIFGLFLGDDSFPPEDLTKDSKWLCFFRKLGLRKKATMEEFISFCTRVATGSQKNIQESSQALMECLFETTSWHEEEQFLNAVSKTPFVCTEPVKDLDWIVPVASVENTIQQRSMTFHLTSLKKAASLEVKDLMWTIKPVIYLPYEKLSPLHKKDKFLRCIQVARQPSVKDVIRNVKQISKSRFANFKLFDYSTDDCTPSTGRKESLFKVLVHCYEYLKDHGCSKEDLNCLQNAPCIPVTTTDISSAVPVTALVTPLQVVASTDSTIKQLVPFLNPLPDGLYSVLPDVLSKLGVTTVIQYGNLRNALETMHQNIEQPLDPNSVKVVKLILKKFHITEIPLATDKPLYLPNEMKMLVESTKLLHDDHGRYKNAHFDTRNLSYSFIFLLTDRNEERSEYGFSSKEFVGRLPSAIRPLPLSVHCYEKLSPSCAIQDHLPHSELITELTRAFRFPDFANVIEKVLLASSVDDDTCKKFTQKLASFCSSAKVSSVPNLKVEVYLTLSRPPVPIGTVKVDFAFLQNTESDSFVVCVDSGAKMKHKLLESFSKGLISTIATVSNVSVEVLGEHVEGKIMSLLEDQSQEGIAELLGELGVRSENLGLCGSVHRTVSVKLGSPIPDYLHHRLRADIHNVFRPQELVGYEITDNNYIFARVNYRVAEATEDGELEKYCISISEDDEEGREVTIIEICKILRMKEVCKDNGIREMVLYNPESDGVQMWETIEDDSLKETLKKVAQELKKIWKIKDKDLRRKAIKAMYLKWHPDKNSHRFATKVFQFLQRQIERLEQGLDVEDPDCSEDEAGFTSELWRSRARWWDEEVRTQKENWRREQDRRRDPSMPTQVDDDDLDEQLRQNSVIADPTTAQVWLKQAEHDLTALQVLMREVNSRRGVCAHVCFMAHQVAEKALKAGMYKLIGLHSSVLRWHQLNGHASAIEQVKPRVTSGLRAMVQTLESYYLDPRYPNRYSPAKVPSDQYTVGDAMRAEETAKSVINIIKKLF